MKLASLKSGRDGKLVIVSRDLTRMCTVDSVAPTLQAAIENWNQSAPRLEALSSELNANPNFGIPFKEAECASPLPRAYQWLDGSAYLNHVALVRRARNEKMPDQFLSSPIMYQGMSDRFLGPCDPIDFCMEEWGVDFEAETAVIVDDVPQGVSPEEALAHIKLFMLVNDISLRALIPQELSKGFGFIHGKPQSAFSPVAVTPDELGPAWRAGKIDLTISSYLNGALFGKTVASEDMNFTYCDLIAHAAKTRPLSAGTILGAGTVSNKPEVGISQPVSAGGRGFSCIVEQRTVETIESGTPATPYLQYGDRITIEMRNSENETVFGAITQQLLKPSGFPHS